MGQVGNVWSFLTGVLCETIGVSTYSYDLKSISGRGCRIARVVLSHVIGS